MRLRKGSKKHFECFNTHRDLDYHDKFWKFYGKSGQISVFAPFLPASCVQVARDRPEDVTAADKKITQLVTA